MGPVHTNYDNKIIRLQNSFDSDELKAIRDRNSMREMRQKNGI